MEFNKQTVKALLGVVCGGIAFAAALLHLDVVAGAAGWLLGILSPLLLGCAKSKDPVYSLTPARCWKVKRRCHR